jgi:hypothetical protein
MEGPVLRFIRPEGRTPSLGCIPVRLAELITEASCTAIPREAARALVEVCTAEADAANSRLCPAGQKERWRTICKGKSDSMSVFPANSA